MHFRRAALVASLLRPSSLARTGVVGNNAGPYAPVVLLLPVGPADARYGQHRRCEPRRRRAVLQSGAAGDRARVQRVARALFVRIAAGGALSAVTRFNTGGIALGMRMADYELPVRRLPGRSRHDARLAGPRTERRSRRASASRRSSRACASAAPAKYAEDNVSPTPSRAARRSTSASSKDVFRFYTVGLAVQNIGTSMTIPCSLPTGLDHATARRRRRPPASDGRQLTTVTPAVAHDARRRDVAAVGEFDFVGTAAVSMLRADWVVAERRCRSGLQLARRLQHRAARRRTTSAPGETPFTAGAGFTMDRLSIDYAFEALPPATQCQRPSPTSASHRPPHRPSEFADAKCRSLASLGMTRFPRSPLPSAHRRMRRSHPRSRSSPRPARRRSS